MYAGKSSEQKRMIASLAYVFSPVSTTESFPGRKFDLVLNIILPPTVMQSLLHQQMEREMDPH